MRLRNTEHISVGTRCGICHEYFEGDDWFVAFFEKPFYDGFTCPRKYSCYKRLEILRANELDSFRYCFDRWCVTCMFRSEDTAAHRDCIRLVEIKNNKSRYEWPLEFWRRTSWRQPWYDGLRLNISHSDRFSGFGDLAVEALEMLGIPLIRHLPAEIIGRIRRLCRSSLFWRYCEVEDFPLSPRGEYHELSDSDIHLRNVYGWTRGQEPMTHDNNNHQEGGLPFGLTFDSWGLKKIERLFARESSIGTPSPYEKFVVVSPQTAGTLLVRFEKWLEQPGAVRLTMYSPMDPEHSPSTVWDIPNPPAYSDLSITDPFLQDRIIPCRQMSTIPLTGCLGITFFMKSGWIIGFHCHTQQEPCAQRSLERLQLPHAERYNWFYVPISEEDEIISFRLKLAGYVSISSESLEPMDIYRWLSIERPQHIFYDMTGPCDSITAVGAVRGDKPASPVRREQFQFTFDACTFYDAKEVPHKMLSHASLDNVVTVRVFYRDDSGNRAGILLKYENGGQRAMGQCRLGIDRVEEHIRPTHICFPPNETWSSRAATFASDPTIYLEENWSCRPMTGSLIFAWTEQTAIFLHRPLTPYSIETKGLPTETDSSAGWRCGGRESVEGMLTMQNEGSH
ncbi:hypothetical protein E4U55_007368 [Claviceps digitariae]|nr:hypothetical protein E4U55_007368 [Claviceps digitariae]